MVPAARLQALVRHAADAILLLDREACAVYASPSTARVLDCAPEKLIGHDPFALLHPEEQRQAHDAFAELLERPAQTHVAQVRVRRSDGSWRAVEAVFTNLMTEPTVAAVVATFRDISERRKTDAALRTGRAQLAAVFHRLDDGILVQDRTGRTLYANEAVARRCGVGSAKALIELPPAELFQRLILLDEAGTPLRHDRLPGRRTLNGEQVPAMTIGFRVRDGDEERWASVTSARVFDALNGSEIVISVLHDITARRRVEDELRQAITLRDAFLSTASHELRTPLTALKGYLDVSRRRLDNGAPPESIIEALDVARRQVHRLTRLVGVLLDASHLSRDALSVETEPLDVAPLVRGVVEAERAAEQPPRAITLVVPRTTPRLNADPVRLERALTNVLQNARRYSQADTPIAVVVTCGSGAVTITIRDAGIGILEEDQEQVFLPFHRGRNVDPGVVGFGLGLYVAREIVQAHGGTLALRSTPGAGSTFTMTLPLHG